MKKILVPVDFSDVSVKAAQFALDIAERNDAEVTLLNSVHFNYSVDYQFASFSAAKSLLEDVKDAMEEKMEKLVESLDAKIKINTVVDSIYLVTAVKEMVNNQGYDLVVIGTSGCSGLEEVFIGSNTEKIVRHAPCPVISVPKESSLKKIEKIMVPIDIREIKDSFLKEVAKLQEKFDATFDFLWVKTPHNIENEEVVSKELSKIIASYGIKRSTLTIENSVFPSDGIIWHADDIKADMIAMATHARRGLSHWFSGSLTEDTVNHIDIPVWTFKLDKKEKPIVLNSVRNAHGKPEYKKIEVLTVD
ncbi:universal stress protein [Ekhidna sp.]